MVVNFSAADVNILRRTIYSNSRVLFEPLLFQKSDDRWL